MRSQTEAEARQLGLGWHRRGAPRCHSGRHTLQPASSTAKNCLSATQQRTIDPGTRKRSQPHSDGLLGARQLRIEPEVAGLRQGFDIIDADDRELLRRF